MRNIEKLTVDENESVIEGIKKIDSAGTRFLMITKKGRLAGTVTDGDIRRHILKNGNMDASISEMMRRNPITIYKREIHKAREIITKRRLVALPVVDDENRILDVVFAHDLLAEDEIAYEQINTPVVIMAGGKGTRLHPYTNILPKPLLPINEKTILDRIIDSFKKNGCREFYLTLNYKKNLIEAYMSERDDDCRVSFVEEDDFYGTCGSIRLLSDSIKDTFFVSNCDVLLDIDYADLLKFHKRNECEITLVTALKDVQIPYGVVELDKFGKVETISEKPSFAYNVNTGIYVMEAGLMSEIPENKVYHMTDLLHKLLTEGRRVGAYPIRDQQWDDMGEMAAMRDMIQKYVNRP